MSEYVRKKFSGRLYEHGRAIWIGRVCIPKSVVKNVSSEYVKYLGNVVELDIKEWFLKKDKNAKFLIERELDENNKYINPEFREATERYEKALRDSLE